MKVWPPGAIFTIPAFVLAHAWPSFGFRDAYWKSTALILVGSVLGVLFISLVRRVMVDDPELPFPESVAASEIHKAGQRGAQAAKYLFWNIGVGGIVFLLGRFGLFAADAEFSVPIGQLGTSRLRLGGAATTNFLSTGGKTVFSGPSVSPAYLGVGYVIGAKLAAIQFSGGVLAWGLMVPLIIYFLGPQLQSFLPAGAAERLLERYGGECLAIYRASDCGGRECSLELHSLFSACGAALVAGLGRALADTRHTAAAKGRAFANRALHELEGGVRAYRRGIRS